MSDLTDAVLAGNDWPTIDELCELVKADDPDYSLGWLRTMPVGLDLIAEFAKKTVYQYAGGEASAKYRRDLAWSVWLAWAYRIIRRYSAATGAPLRLDRFGLAYLYWQKQRGWLKRVTGRAWEDPDAQLLRQLREAAEVNWGGFNP